MAGPGTAQPPADAPSCTRPSSGADHGISASAWPAATAALALTHGIARAPTPPAERAVAPRPTQPPPTLTQLAAPAPPVSSTTALVPVTEGALAPPTAPPTASPTRQPPSRRITQLCEFDGCVKKATSGHSFCLLQGAARKCEHEGCSKIARTGGPPFCKAHGGGRRCQDPGCDKSAASGGSPFCAAHGGGRRCSIEGCEKSARAGGQALCAAHGGGKRCQHEGCQKSARAGGSNYCAAHGGGRRCAHTAVAVRAPRLAARPSALCTAAGGDAHGTRARGPQRPVVFRTASLTVCHVAPCRATSRDNNNCSRHNNSRHNNNAPRCARGAEEPRLHSREFAPRSRGPSARHVACALRWWQALRATEVRQERGTRRAAVLHQSRRRQAM